MEAFTETGRWLGYGIRDLINLFNPEVVVLGGLYHRFFGYLEKGMAATAQAAIRASGEMATIAPSSVGPDASLIGASELVMADAIDDPASIAG